MIALFDLDGVLIDSADLIRQAYRGAGVQAPRDVLATEGEDWLIAQVGEQASVVRAHKNRLYVSYLRSGMAAFLPPIDTAHMLVREGHAVISLSAAPSGTLSALTQAHPDRWLPPIINGLRTPQKMELIRMLPPPGVYVDDQDKFIDLPRGWHFVRYTGQTPLDLFKEMLSCCSA